MRVTDETLVGLKHQVSRAHRGRLARYRRPPVELKRRRPGTAPGARTVPDEFFVELNHRADRPGRGHLARLQTNPRGSTNTNR